MKKILIITQSLSVDDGLGRYSMGLIKHLKKSYKLIILTSKLGSFREGYVEDKNIEYHKIPCMNKFFNVFYNFLYSWKLQRFFREVDFIHSFFDFPYCLLPFWNPFFKKPVFITAHGTYSVLPFDNLKTRFFMRRAYEKAERIFCISKFTEKEILKRVSLKNTIVINNGIEYEKFANFYPRNTKNISQGGIILTVGVLKPRKGYHVSIPAITEVKKKYPQLKYYIVGGKPPDIYLKMVKDYGIEDNVVFFENISDEELIKLYYQCDLFLLTSVVINNNEFEGFGLVYLEAGACGKPVIGAFGSGAEDAIINEETGILVPQNDIQKTAEAILKLLDNPKLAEKMGENGKKRAQEMDWESQVKKYIQIYENTFSVG